MKKLLVALLFLTAVAEAANAQNTRYIIQFKDKSTTPFTIAAPEQYLSQRSIRRRTRYSIAIDSTDLPVTPRYIDSIRLAGSVTILNVSKWLNQVSIQTTDAAALAKINSLTFVKAVKEIAAQAKRSEDEITARVNNQNNVQK